MIVKKELLLELRGKEDLQTTGSDSHSATPYGIPIFTLLDQIERKRKCSSVEDSFSPASSQNATKKKKQGGPPSQLMAEKYRPKQYFELLGNDDANRQILRWLHFWKSCVFGLPPVLNDYTDRLGRPLRKVLLLNGPPGTGKTSAAHVIAKQAGFDILEINASDERGAAVVKSRIESAIGSHQVLSKRPILIVADEVEGASEHGFVKALTNILKQDEKALGLLEKGNYAKNRKGKKMPSLLLRPIIAICNDVWSPNLHSLRAHSEIVHFHRQAPVKLLKRLEVVCINENIRISTRQLSRIAEQCDYDLRACLNAIQFDSNIIADSDSKESAEIVDWHSLVKRQFLCSRPSTFQQLESCSDPDKLVTGCFTAYPESAYIDDVMKKPAALGDYLALSDSRRANDELKAFVAHGFGQLFRSPYVAAQKDSFQVSKNKMFGKPPSHYEEFKRTKSLVGNVLVSSSAQLKPFYNEKRLLLETLPFIISISNPSTQTILSSDDNIRLRSIAEAFRDVGISLRTEKTINGEFIHRLDPPVELACVFGEENQVAASAGLYMARCHIKDTIRDLRNSTQAQQGTQPTRGRVEHDSSRKHAAVKEIKIPVDMSSYFGLKKPESLTQMQLKAGQQASRVWVQYSEGFSNAVRKSIGWQEMLYL